MPRETDCFRLLLRLSGLGLLLSAGCESPRSRAAYAPYFGTDSMGVVVRARAVRARLPRELTEASAVVWSATSGLLFAINDSGHDPVVFALDTTGAHRGTWRVDGATNVDWEAASSGPCGAPADSLARSCLYIGDVGDNAARRPWAVIYRIAEPSPRAATGTAPRAEAVAYRYADGAHDVEAMYVGGNGAMYLVTKRPLDGANARPRPALVFRLGADVWRRGDSTAVAELIDSLPIVPGSAPGRMVTDAALAPDGRHVVLRTYGQAYVFAADPETGRIRTNLPPSICNIAVLRERQGEAITWLDARGRLLLMSEGRKEPLRVFDCPLPPL